MSVSTTTYTLDASELASIRTLIEFQTSHGIDAGAVAPATIDGFIGGLDKLSASSGAVKNTRITAYFGDLFAGLEKIGTVNGFNFTQIYIMNLYANSCNRGDVLYKGNPYDYFPFDFGWNGSWRNFLHGFTFTTTCDDDWDDERRYVDPWHPPAGPPTWHAAVAAQLKQWGDNPPANYIDDTNHLYTRKYGSTTCYWASLKPLFVSEKSKVNGWLTSWPASTPTIMQSIAPVWTTQKQDILALLAPDTLPADSYFFLLYLLPALVTGDAASQALATRIVNAPTSSAEYPNDIFVNQLVYLALIYLADPMGPFGWNNQQLQTGVRELASVVVRSDPASAALRTSLQQHAKILHSDASYPLVDPYNPSIGLPQRKTDTLFALDKARASIRQGAMA